MILEHTLLSELINFRTFILLGHHSEPCGFVLPIWAWILLFLMLFGSCVASLFPAVMERSWYICMIYRQTCLPEEQISICIISFLLVKINGSSTIYCIHSSFVSLYFGTLYINFSLLSILMGSWPFIHSACFNLLLFAQTMSK